MVITNDIIYAGVDDKEIRLFEGQYNVPYGMSYNSYVILDEKIAVMDTTDTNFVPQWMENVEKILGGKQPDYLVVHHMEPDHASGIYAFAKKYPDAKIVSSAKAFVMMKNFGGENFPERQVVIKEGDTLELGAHTLTFVAAPMVHWPEVMVSYDSKDKVLFAADGFGKFGAIESDDEEDWACEARRYYIGIVGKYGAQVQNLLKKASKLDIAIICPLHGPVLTEDLGYYINLYDIWSSYRVENENGVTVAFASAHGNTKKAAELMAEELKKLGKDVDLFDLARCDMAEAVEGAFENGTLVLASITYNADIFPFMKDFINHLTERNFQNRKIAFIENGSWAPTAAKTMAKMLEGCKNLTYAENTVHITSALSDDSKAQIAALAHEIA